MLVEHAREALVGLAIIVVLAAVTAGCGAGLTSMDPVLMHGPRNPDQSALIQRLVSVAERSGYHPAPVQPSRCRFGVVARYTESNESYRMAVECFEDGSIRVTPIGARVELFDDRFILPEGLRDEMAVFAQRLARAAR